MNENASSFSAYMSDSMIMCHARLGYVSIPYFKDEDIVILNLLKISM